MIDLTDQPAYQERLTSSRTSAQFLFLSLVFLWLGRRRLRARGRGVLGAAFFVLCGMFLFYVVNYRTLVIRLTPEALHLQFGLFRCTIAMGNIASCRLDDVSLWRIGGAGIHFSPMRGRYRAMFNFLEHDRVVVGLKEKRGPVWDIAFSTRRPEWVLCFIQEHAEFA